MSASALGGKFVRSRAGKILTVVVGFIVGVVLFNFGIDLGYHQQQTKKFDFVNNYHFAEKLLDNPVPPDSLQLFGLEYSRTNATYPVGYIAQHHLSLIATLAPGEKQNDKAPKLVYTDQDLIPNENIKSVASSKDVRQRLAHIFVSWNNTIYVYQQDSH